MHGDQGYVLTWRNVVLATRVFEAHFLPMHLFLVTIFSTIFTTLPASLVRSGSLTVFLDFTAYLRAMGFCLMLIYFFFFYEGYHHVCVEAREAEMKEAGLYEEMEESFSKRNKNEIRTWARLLGVPYCGYRVWQHAADARSICTLLVGSIGLQSQHQTGPTS